MKKLSDETRAAALLVMIESGIEKLVRRRGLAGSVKVLNAVWDVLELARIGDAVEVPEHG